MPKLPSYRNQCIEICNAVEICRANQLTDFYMMATLAFNELIKNESKLPPRIHFLTDKLPK